MKSGGGVLLIGGLELVCGFVLLFIYEASKTNFYAQLPQDDPSGGPGSASAIGARPFHFHCKTPPPLAGSYADLSTPACHQLIFLLPAMQRGIWTSARLSTSCSGWPP